MTSASGGQRSIQLSYGRWVTPEWMAPVSSDGWRLVSNAIETGGV